MIKIINNILSNNGYELIDIVLPFDNMDISLFCPSYEKQREEYFVTIQLHTQSNETAIDLLENRAEELFEAIRDSGKVERYFIKNSTMLMCHDENRISRQTIFSLEENPYNFKKNVITYLPIELIDLENYLASNSINQIININISEIINSQNGQNFLDFKSNHKNIQNYYSLIVKIALKLPFITYAPPEKELINLCLNIEECLSERHSFIYKKLIDPEVEWSEHNIYEQVEKIWRDLI